MPLKHTDFNKIYRGAPDWEILKKIIPFAEFMKMYHHYRVDGIQKIPQTGRAMVLVNHSLATYDIMLLGYSIYEKVGRLPHGLADKNFYKNELTAKIMHKIGVYEANHDNAEEVLKKEELLMLAPGGTREAIRSSKEKFQIKWDDRKGFARLAIKTQTPVILAACPGADNIYSVEENKLTELAYKFFKFPLTFAKGVGNTMIPRPVKMVHYVHAPILPPVWEGDTIDEQVVNLFHEQIVDRMEEWMKEKTLLYQSEFPKKK